MTALILSLAALVSAPLSHAEPSAKAQMSCTAVYRTLDDKNNTVERTADVPVRATLGEQVKHLAQFQGRTFILTEDRADLFGQIVTPSDLAHGVTSRGTPDALGRFHLAEVSGYTVYRLECSRIN